MFQTPKCLHGEDGVYKHPTNKHSPEKDVEMIIQAQADSVLRSTGALFVETQTHRRDGYYKYSCCRYRKTEPAQAKLGC